MVSIPRRSPLTWGLCVLFSAAAWGFLLSGHTSAGVSLMFAGGWNLSLLPVQARRFCGIGRRSTPQAVPRAPG
ncbi:hypothetical protein ABH940_005660 [Streptacidiphilus sp. BW17]